jgi:hypothetical protein
MSKNKFAIISVGLFFSLLFTGCSYKESMTQSHDRGFLKFSKNMFKSYKVVVNDKYSFVLDHCVYDEEIPREDQCQGNYWNKLYEVRSGNVYLKIFDSKDQLIFSKEIYLGSNTTYEVKLP